MSKSVSVDDFAEELGKALQEYADMAGTEMKKAVRKSAGTVKKEISENAPVKSGRYKASWTTSKTGETSQSLIMTVHSKNRYQLAHLLENGHARRGGGRVLAIPHIRPAEKKGVEQLESEIRKALGG